jgi:hypothetical protein
MQCITACIGHEHVTTKVLPRRLSLFTSSYKSVQKETKQKANPNCSGHYANGVSIHIVKPPNYCCKTAYARLRAEMFFSPSVAINVYKQSDDILSIKK